MVRFECGSIQKPVTFYLTKYSKFMLLVLLFEVEFMVLIPVLILIQGGTLLWVYCAYGIAIQVIWSVVVSLLNAYYSLFLFSSYFSPTLEGYT